MTELYIANWQLLAPELFMCAAIFALLLFGVYRAPLARPALSAVAILIIIGAGILLARSPEGEHLALSGLWITNDYIVFVKYLTLIAAALAVLLANRWLTEGSGKPFEFIILLLFTLLGLMFMLSANDFLSLYIPFELWSLSVYVMASFDRDRLRSNEAGLKYFVLGALASGMLLFGITLVYGFTGSTSFSVIGQWLNAGGDIHSGLVVGLVLIMIGFSFKLSAVPFHMWTPDVYQGAPTPVTALMATLPKVGVMAVFIKLLVGPFVAMINDWEQIIIAMAVLSLTLGSFAAIWQSNIKRLLAYSSIGHIGFILLGVLAGTTAGVQAALIYLTIYIFMSAGMFACILFLQKEGDTLEDIPALSGLSTTHPALAAAIALLMFSMAGIPPLAGFFGKFYVIIAAVDAGYTLLAIYAVLTSVVATYYYIRIVKIMYFDASETAPIMLRSKSLTLCAGLCIAVNALFFLVPTSLVAASDVAAQALLP